MKIMRGQMLDWEYFHETNIYVICPTLCGNNLLHVQTLFIFPISHVPAQPGFSEKEAC